MIQILLKHDINTLRQNNDSTSEPKSVILHNDLSSCSSELLLKPWNNEYDSKQSPILHSPDEPKLSKNSKKLYEISEIYSTMKINDTPDCPDSRFASKIFPDYISLPGKLTIIYLTQFSDFV